MHFQTAARLREEQLQAVREDARTGWDYGDARAAVGVPFPIQTAVLTAEGTRAWQFSDATFVKATKFSWRGCNDGGDAQVLWMVASSDRDSVLPLPLRTAALSVSSESVTPGRRF